MDMDNIARQHLLERDKKEREAEERREAEAQRLRAELRVLEAIQRYGVAWPGEY